MAFDWNSYQPETGGIAGRTAPVDPSQLQQVDPGRGITFDPAQASPSSPMNPQNAPTTSQGAPVGVDGARAPVTAPGQMWDQNYFTQNFGTPRTPQELVALESKITAAGGKVLRNASGVAGKIQTPDGRIIDVINSAGAGGNGFQWLDGGGGSGPTANGYGSLNGLNAGYMTSPIGQFTPPSFQDALNDPGAQYAIDEATRKMQNSAAARGTLLNGRQLQAQNQAIMANANTLYGDIYNRAANTYGINFNTQTRNQDAPFNKYVTLADLGQRAASAS